jgi:hypothetical protein
MTTEEIRAMWQRFFALAPEFHKNQRNVDIVATEAQALVKSRHMPVSEQTLLAAYKRIKDALDTKPKDAQAPSTRVEPVSDEPQYSEATDPLFPKQGNLENSWEFEKRKAAYRESRAQKAWRDRENKRLLEAPAAQSTITRTKAELKLRKLEQEQYWLRKANQS